MRRSLILISLLALLIPTSAEAASFTLPLSDKYGYTDHYVYWAQAARGGCKNCSELWRANADGGARVMVRRFRHATIQDLTGRGDLFAYTLVRDGKIMRTSVRTLSESGKGAELAHAYYRSSATRDCGSLVGAGAFSAAGELAWQRVDVRGKRNNPLAATGCAGMGGRIYWSAYAGGLGRVTRRIVAPRRVDSPALTYRDGLQYTFPLDAYNGTGIISYSNQYGLDVVDIAARKWSFYEPSKELARTGPARLADNGAVAAIYEETIDGPTYPYLFPHWFDPTVKIDLTVSNRGTAGLRFCGDELLQLTYGAGNSTVIVRDLAGNVLRTRELPGGYPATSSLACTGDRLAILYYVNGSDGEPKATHFETFSRD